MRRTAWMLEQLSAQVQAQNLMDEHEYEKARDLLTELIGVLERAGCPAGHAHWMLCVACDNLGDLPNALLHVEKAIEVDPVSVPFHRSFDVITNRMRGALADEARAVDDPTTQQLYDLLMRSSETDAVSHLVMARHLAAKGEGERAMRLLDSLVTLDPLNHEAWKLLAEVARAAGMEEKAGRAELEAAATVDQGPGARPGASMGAARS